METTQETSNLISSEKVAGTEVYNTAGENMGEIREVMLDKRSGTVAYAVMSFGGFLGMGEKYHPLPWSLLKYDTGKGGYVVNLDKQQLEGAPVLEPDSDLEWDQAYDKEVSTYYGTKPYWMGIMP
jgi:sporulation protein YlmC with PRC-barrel domain